jgi:hypothetical protein
LEKVYNPVDNNLGDLPKLRNLDLLNIRLNALEDKLNVFMWSFIEEASRENSSKDKSKEKVPKAELWIRRDLLVVALERDWYKIEKFIMMAKTDAEYRDILKTVLGARFDLSPRLQFKKLGDLFKQQPLQIRPSKKILRAFGERDKTAIKLFNRLPSRAIANAIAGAPEYSCWSSFKYATCHPSSVPICDSLWWHFKKKYKAIVPEPKVMQQKWRSDCSGPEVIERLNHEK